MQGETIILIEDNLLDLHEIRDVLEDAWSLMPANDSLYYHLSPSLRQKKAKMLAVLTKLRKALGE